MNDSKNSSKGLLVLRYPCDLSQETANKLTEFLTPTAEALGVEPLVLGNGADARLDTDYSALLTRLCVAVERLVAQGEPPQLSEEIAPQALNARPTGLNSRPIGSSGEMSNSSAPREGQLGYSVDHIIGETFTLNPSDRVTPRG